VNWMILIVAILGVAVFVYETMIKSKWGINLSPPKTCAKCDATLPKGPRRPTDKHEAMWGGWTCPGCGAKMDKFGKLRQ